MTSFNLMKQQLSTALNSKTRNDLENMVTCLSITVLQALERLEELHDGPETEGRNRESQRTGR